MAVLIKHGIRTSLLRQIENHESLTLKLFCSGRTLLLSAVYRAPDAPPRFLKDLRDHLGSFSCKEVMIVGDFNLPSVDWRYPFSNTDRHSDVGFLLDIMLNLDVRQVVTEPTRVCDASSSILDLAFVTRTIEECTVSVNPGISDHAMVLLSCNLEKPCIVPSEIVSVKDFSRARDESVLDYLEIKFNSFQGSDVNILWDQFKQICTYCLDNFIPNKTKKTRKSNPWITREVLHLKRKLKRIRKRGAAANIVEAARTAFNEALKRSKWHYFQHTLPNFLNESPQKFWDFLNQKKKSVDEIQIDGVQIVDKEAIAEHFNSYFHSVFSIPSERVSLTPVSCSDLEDIVSLQGIVAMLLNLKSKTSPGPDGLPNAFLRRYAEVLAPFLACIFRASISSADLPVDWRTARVVPIHKKGDTALISNYRPISLTSSCCKMLEHIIANHVITFLTDNNILSSFQHGFRKGFSTVTQLTTVIHNFASVMDKSGQTDVIFLDFRKAFDLVSHQKLVFKLRYIGLPPFIINWISAYLANRVQSVSVNGHHSRRLPVTSGVPQGSVLGPLLFLIFINDIVNVVTEPVQVRLFADDCILFHEIACREDQELLNTNLHSIYSWCKQWDMQLNEEKTVYMQITKKKHRCKFPYNLPTHHLVEVNEYKYLGVTITNNLSWNSHISNVCAASFRKLCILRHKLKQAPPETKLHAYKSLIRPKLEYACTVWDPHNKHSINALEMIQRKAVRFIFSKYRISDSPTTIMRNQGIQTLQLRRKILRLKFLFLLKNNKLSIDPAPYVRTLTTRVTRHHHSESLTPYQTRTNTFKFSFFPRTIEEWNAVPLSLLNSTDSIDLINF